MIKMRNKEAGLVLCDMAKRGHGTYGDGLELYISKDVFSVRRGAAPWHEGRM